MEILANHARILNGYPFRTALKPADTGPVLVIQPKDVGEVGYRRLWTGSLYMYAPESPVDQYRVQNGDVLFLARATKDHAVLVQDLPEGRPVIASGQFFIIRPRETVLPRYLVWFLNQPPTRAYFLGKGGTSTIPYVRRDLLLCTPLDLPPLHVQEGIVRVAELWQREQELVRQQMEKRNQLVSSICWTAVDRNAGEMNVDDTTTD